MKNILIIFKMTLMAFFFRAIFQPYLLQASDSEEKIIVKKFNATRKEAQKEPNKRILRHHLSKLIKDYLSIYGVKSEILEFRSKSANSTSTFAVEILSVPLTLPRLNNWLREAKKENVRLFFGTFLLETSKLGLYDSNMKAVFIKPIEENGSKNPLEWVKNISDDTDSTFFHEMWHHHQKENQRKNKIPNDDFLYLSFDINEIDAKEKFVIEEITAYFVNVHYFFMKMNEAFKKYKNQPTQSNKDITLKYADQMFKFTITIRAIIEGSRPILMHAKSLGIESAGLVPLTDPYPSGFHDVQRARLTLSPKNTVASNLNFVEQNISNKKANRTHLYFSMKQFSTYAQEKNMGRFDAKKLNKNSIPIIKKIFKDQIELMNTMEKKAKDYNIEGFKIVGFLKKGK